MTKQMISYRFRKQARLLALAALFLAPFWAWGQTDYSGTYFIGVYGKNSTSQYNPSNPSNNFYLCPTEDWLYYLATNTCQHEPDNGQPFITSFQCKNGSYEDPANAIWVITKHATEDYYYIQQRSTGKYLVFNEHVKVGNTGGANRIRVHLEETTLPNEYALFAISTVETNDDRNGYWLFHPKKASSGYYLNITEGNHASLQGTNAKTDGPEVPEYTPYSTYVGGTIGQWNQANNTSSFYLEDFPIITYNSSNLIEITALQFGADLIYTTDGSTPSTTNPNAITISGTAGSITNTSFDPADDVTTIKAIAIWGDNKETSVATFQPIVLLGSAHPRLIQNQNNAWNTTDFHFYMIPGDEENSIPKVNTTSLFRPSMKWYFLNAGMEDGDQYYYIVNDGNGKYLCYNTTNGVHVYTYTNDTKFKFRIVESPTAGTYNIIPYGLTSGNRFLNKSGTNANANNIILYNNNTDANARWKFVLPSELDTDNPFTPSSSNNYSYFKIASVGSNGYYIIPGTTNATTSNSNDAAIVNSMNWYFEVAQTASNADWLNYFHIRNAVTGDYLYFTKDGNNAGACLEMRSTIDSENADRYMFTWAKTADANANYYIVPKMLKDVSQNQFSALQRNNTTLQTNLTRAAANFAWTFPTSSFNCAQPVISYDATENGYVITATESDAKIYYMMGSGTLNPSTGTLYSGAISVAELGVESTTIRAIVARNSDGSDASDEASVTVYRVDTPQFSFTEDGKVLITCDTVGVTIHYEMGNPGAVNTPTTSSPTYVGPIENAAGQVIKALAVKDRLINSPIATSDVIVFNCATPVIRKTSSTTFTITCSFPTSGVTIRYNIGENHGVPDAPTSTSGTIYNNQPVTFGLDDLPLIVKAIAYATNYDNSAVATKVLTDDLPLDEDGYYIIASHDDFEKFVTMVNESVDNASAKYKITDDINVSGVDVIEEYPFSGELKSIAKADGSYPVLSGLSHAIFNTVNGGTVKNVILDNVSISGSGNVGAICNEADGATKIYNCGILSGSVSGGTNTGGLVGLIEAGSSVRVVNCYNFANVTGGGTDTYAAGIVGKNEGTVASDGTVGNVRIALCMMYGSVSGATNISPVYGGNHVDNVLHFTEYNYWRYRSGLQYTALNDQLPIEEDEYLKRFPFFRHILNSHRELAAFFLFGGASCNDMAEIADDDIAEIGHWALKKDVAAYPIIEPWPTNTQTTQTSTNNNLPSTTEDYAGKLLTEMGTNGYLSVSVFIGSHTYSVSLPITDMDTLNYDFTWGKVVLPFANEFEVNTDYSKICTGWKITGITGGTAGTFEHYNVSDRRCTTKDLYNTTGFIFAQGGNYIVPYGVTGITITANFATAYYLCDENYEIAYSGNRTGNDDAGYIGRTGLAGSTPDTYHNRPVYHTLAAALNAITSSTGSTHEHAVVLIGNYHHDDVTLSDAQKKKGCTIMSIDEDNNQEPDYAWYSNHTQNRPEIQPTRFDFVALIPLGMSSHLHGSVHYPNIPIWKPHGWFEITETSFTRAAQFEIESNKFNASDSDTRNYRCIINGGYFTQMVRSRNAACTKLSYYQIGGKAYVKEFYPGNHSQNNYANTLVPINVTGGEIEQCFMTGYGQGKAYGTDIYFWCAGGRIHKFLGAYMEPPVETSNNDESNPGTVNLTAKIDHARIYRFFGGGTTSKARITGDIKVTIDNSFVDFYCGGPEFGDMVTGDNGKTVETTADHTTFREYYGAGFGGTAVSYTNDKDETLNFNNTSILPAGQTDLAYPSGYFGSCYLNESTSIGRLDYKADYGIGNCYKYEYIMHSRGHATVARFYTGYASFSLAKTGSVTNTLTNCTVERSFYGGGCQGTVDGTVTSTLTDCTIGRSAFGGGYKAVSNQVEVYSETQTNPLSTYYGESSVFSDFGPIPPSSETYTWEQGTQGHSNTADAANHKLYTGTNVTLADLGNVTGDITITLKGKTTVNGNVFGGGNESKSLANTLVEILGRTKVFGNIYGGGNMGVVGGNTKVIINGQQQP